MCFDIMEQNDIIEFKYIYENDIYTQFKLL